MNTMNEQRKVLVVDDYRDAVETSKILLADHGHSVSTALTIDEALEITASTSFDVIFTDLKGAPAHDGFAFCKHLREQQKFEQCVLFAISGLSDTASIRHAEDVGFDYFSVKPVDPALFVESVRCPRPSPLVRARLSLTERTKALAARCNTLLERNQRSIQKSTEIIQSHQNKQFRQTVVFDTVSAEKLALAVSRKAVELGGLRRVCYVVVNVESGTIVQADEHFRTATEAKKFARRFGLNGYFYPIFQQDAPHSGVFPTAKQILHYLKHRAFES